MPDLRLTRAAMTTAAVLDALLNGPRGAHLTSALDQANAAVDQLGGSDVTAEAVRLLLAAVAECQQAGSPSSTHLVSRLQTVRVALWFDARFMAEGARI